LFLLPVIDRSQLDFRGCGLLSSAACRKGATGHLDFDPNAHAVGTKLDRIYRRPKRLECAVAVQRARLMDANPWTGPPDRGIFRVLGTHANLRQRQIVDGT
jgi:hypothetical protein